VRCTNARFQERRASARRGVTYRRCVVRIEHCPATGEASIKSGERQPAVRTKRICNGASFSRSEYVRAPRGAYAPRSWLHDATLTAKSDIVDAHTHTHEERRASGRRGNGVEPWMVNRNSPTGSRTQQERRASARRGVTYRRCAVRIEHCPATGEASIKSGERQPAVRTKRICNGASFSRSEYVRAPRGAYAPRSWLHDATLTAKSDIVDAHTHTHEERRASGRRGNGVEPWMVNRNSPAGSRTHQERRASGRRGAGIAPATLNTFCRTMMPSYHGGLTPPAPGGSAVRTFADETAACAMHERSFPKSGGRQPAVV
jgi:Zn-finger nucleic acid-binding protein